jgi:hypothetical protein
LCFFGWLSRKITEKGNVSGRVNAKLVTHLEEITRESVFLSTWSGEGCLPNVSKSLGCFFLPEANVLVALNARSRVRIDV